MDSLLCLTDELNGWDKVLDVLTKNTEGFQAKTHLDVSNDLKSVFEDYSLQSETTEQETLKHVLNLAFQPPPVEEEKELSVPEMYDFMERILGKRVSQRK